MDFGKTCYEEVVNLLDLLRGNSCNGWIMVSIVQSCIFTNRKLGWLLKSTCISKFLLLSLQQTRLHKYRDLVNYCWLVWILISSQFYSECAYKIISLSTNWLHFSVIHFIPRRQYLCVECQDGSGGRRNVYVTTMASYGVVWRHQSHDHLTLHRRYVPLSIQ